MTYMPARATIHLHHFTDMRVDGHMENNRGFKPSAINYHIFAPTGLVSISVHPPGSCCYTKACSTVDTAHIAALTKKTTVLLKV